MSKTEAGKGAGRLIAIMGVLQKHNIISGLTPEKLRLILEDLGPTFVKLGQILSMRLDLLPQTYCDELQKLRSSVAPMTMDEVVRVIEASLGKPVEDVFPTIDPTPLGSASIAQVHHATLPDGTQVVVKVQRAGIREVMSSDIVLLRKAAKLLKLTPTGDMVDFSMVLEEMWTVSQQEMDFINEAANAEEFRSLNEAVAYVSCPAIYRELSTRQVLVMEAIDGIRIDQVEALTAEKYDMEEISRKLCLNYMKQVLDDGFFHADPHPGNLLIRDGQIIWIDLGMMGRLSPRDQKLFQKGLSAAVSGDIGALTDMVLTISHHTTPVKRDALYADVDTLVSQYLQLDIGAMNLSDLMQQVMEVAGKHGLALPPGLSLLARGVSTLEGLLADISPDVNLMEVLSQRFARDALKDTDIRKILLHNGKAIYESIQKSMSTPALVNDALRAALKGDIKIRVEDPAAAAEAQERAREAEKMRSTLLCAAGLIASAMLSLSGAQPKWWGLAWPSVVGFAITGLLYVLYGIKRWRRKRR